jgi:squalene-hopene/tetraprenyl-beta-curcumene cyclase
MRNTILSRLCFFYLVVFSCIPQALIAYQDVTLENVETPVPNHTDEPVAKELSLEKAAHFLDSAALTWQKERKCFTCHTNFAYLYARPAISAKVTAHQQVRAFAEELVQTRWPDQGPRWDAEIVAAAAALAFNDSATSGQLQEASRTALDRMWTVQKEDGGFSWLKCDWPPMESDDHYGVTLAAIAVGVAPDNYATTPAAEKGMQGIRRWLNANAPPTLHHQAMLLWANSYTPDLLTAEQKSVTIQQLTALQKSDGGWALATLGNWERGDDLQQDTEHSDGYGTGFVLYALRRAGVESSHDAIQRGVKWLKSNQRESGRWYTRSLFKDNHHFISHAGTAMAVMALKQCEEPAAGRVD